MESSTGKMGLCILCYGSNGIAVCSASFTVIHILQATVVCHLPPLALRADDAYCR